MFAHCISGPTLLKKMEFVRGWSPPHNRPIRADDSCCGSRRELEMQTNLAQQRGFFVS